MAVKAAAQKLGYEPDAIAQSMRRGSTGMVGMIVSDFANPFYAAVIRAAEARLQQAGLALLVANTDNDRRKEKHLLELFRRRRIDGLIIGPCEREDVEMIRKLDSETMPVVIYERDFGETGGGLQIDHGAGGLQATRYLLNLGHRRIALFSSGSNQRPGRERIAGYRAAHEELGLTVDPKLIRAAPSTMEFVLSEALALLSLKSPPTAFICLGTRILAGVLQALRHCGLSVPADASVISVGDSDLARLFSPAITSVTWDIEAAGAAVAEQLLARLGEDPPTEPSRIVLTPQLVVRDSCGPV